MKFVRWLGGLAQDYQRCFFIFMLGLSVFFIGLAAFYLSAQYYQQSHLLAELLALASLLIMAVGAAIAVVGYLSLTYYRWYHFFRKKN